MTNSYREISPNEMREDFLKFTKKYNMQMGLKYFKLLVIGLFLASFIASAISSYTEYKVREEYAMRDLTIATEVAPIWNNAKSALPWEQVLKDANRITTQWVKDGRKNPNDYYLYYPNN